MTVPGLSAALASLAASTFPPGVYWLKYSKCSVLKRKKKNRVHEFLIGCQPKQAK